MLRQFPGALLKDMAGNAFDGANYQAASTALLCTLAECHRRTLKARGECAALVPPGLWFGDVWPDSDSEWWGGTHRTSRSGKHRKSCSGTGGHKHEQNNGVPGHGQNRRPWAETRDGQTNIRTYK